MGKTLSLPRLSMRVCVAENVGRFGFVLYRRLAEGTEEYHDRPGTDFEETRHFLLQ